MEVNTLINHSLTAAIDWLQEDYSYYNSFMTDGVGGGAVRWGSMYQHAKKWL